MIFFLVKIAIRTKCNQRTNVHNRIDFSMGRLKKTQTGILLGHVDEGSTIALAQQLDDFKSSTAQGTCTTTPYAVNMAWS